jgi:hypothetical protein
MLTCSMKNGRLVFFALYCCYACFCSSCVDGQKKNLKLVFIRHAEKPDGGDNLNCLGLNRSFLLPGVLYKKFGVPDNVYVPTLNQGNVTKHARMLQTVTPFVAKYRLSVNTKYDEDDSKGLSKALMEEKGTVLIVWEHKNLPHILHALGVKARPDWPDNDFDSIWIVTFPKGLATLTRDAEGLKPAKGCPF